MPTTRINLDTIGRQNLPRWSTIGGGRPTASFTTCGLRRTWHVCSDKWTSIIKLWLCSCWNPQIPLGLVLFLEEDMYLTKDTLHTLGMLDNKRIEEEDLIVMGSRHYGPQVSEQTFARERRRQVRFQNDIVVRPTRGNNVSFLPRPTLSAGTGCTSTVGCSRAACGRRWSINYQSFDPANLDLEL